MTSTLLARPAPSVAPTPSTGDDPPPAIHVRGLRKAYGERTVLDGLSFDVARGEIFGILGANGTGKTTSVEILQGLRARDGGEVAVLGCDPARDARALRGRVGAQLQSSALPERLRVGEALRLFARLAGDVVDPGELAAQWDLVRLQGTAFGALSGGERQRLFVALALVSRPELVFLDELTQGLDPAARQATWRLIRRIRDAGTTVVLVTHYMDEAEQLCDRLGVLHGGRLTACGTPEALIADVGGTVAVRFSCDDAGTLAGLERVPGVAGVSHDGARASVDVEPAAVVGLVAELARRGLAPPDLTVAHPTLEDVFVALTAEVAS